MTPLTIQGSAEGIHKEKGSKFLTFAFPVATEDQVKSHLKSLKKKYFDARHHGYAYMLGPAKEKSRGYDDGEPAHSTGDPILGQLKSKNLTNVLVVVVRYFGSVKLGVGRLISAYKTAAEHALNHAAIIEEEVTERFELIYDYVATLEAMRLVKEFELSILIQDFKEGCRMSVESKLRNRDIFLEKIKLLKALGVKLTLIDR